MDERGHEQQNEWRDKSDNSRQVDDENVIATSTDPAIQALLERFGEEIEFGDNMPFQNDHFAEGYSDDTDGDDKNKTGITKEEKRKRRSMHQERTNAVREKRKKK